MESNNSRPVKRRLRKDRVFVCLAILVLFIVSVSSIISGCSKKDKKDKKPTAVDVKVSDVTTTAPLEGNGDYIICIDPGHGGTDPGSHYGDRYERTDNLKYATLVYEELNKREGITAIMTRTTDTDMTTQERADFANRAGADLYLALHRNYSTDSTACGVEVWVQQENDTVDDVLGYKLLRELEKVGIQRNRGVQNGFTNDKQNNFQIIENTDMWCCILELGFISNDEDNRLFDMNYEKYAIAIADVAEQMCNETYLDTKRKK